MDMSVDASLSGQLAGGMEPRAGRFTRLVMVCCELRAVVSEVRHVTGGHLAALISAGWL